MRRFRIECIAYSQEPEEIVWEVIVAAVRPLLRSYAPEVDFGNQPNGWSYRHDTWHHWEATYDATEWVVMGTLVYAGLVDLMLRNDPDLAGFAATLYYQDHAGEWVECG